MNSDEKNRGEGFLSRWSQRKQEAKFPAAESAAANPAEQEGAAMLPPVAETEADEEFDLSSLPKLEDVTETTDITGFLRKGVPESLRNAALRKSWALDPAIRNYVNPALDYAYDWNTPGGVPGNSEIAAGTDIAKMVLQIMGDHSTAPVHESDALTSNAASDVGAAVEIGASQNPTAGLDSRPVRLSATAPTAAVPAPDGCDDSERVTPDETVQAGAPQQELRRHGTAKPRV